MNSFDLLTHRLRPEHFDPFSKTDALLVPHQRQGVFFHSGDFGDIIYALPTIRALGGGHLVIGPSPLWKTRLQMTAEHVELLRSLLELQPYIKSVNFSETTPDNVDFDLNRFREYLVMEPELLKTGQRRFNLAEAHLYTFKMPIAECRSSWLTVDRVETIAGRPVLIHRSARWRNAAFPWAKIMERYAAHAVFVGLESEYEDFIEEWGRLPFRPTSTFLGLARLIAGCELYIGNQSLPYALCEGLKQRSILEVWTEGANCQFERKNAFYGDGRLLFVPKLDDLNMNEHAVSCPLCGQAAPNTEATVTCECGMVYARVRGNNHQYYQHYADDHSHMRLPKTVDEIRTSGLRREALVQELSIRIPPGTLLDVGCGWGAFLACARERGFTVYGVDICHKAANFSASVLGIPTLCDELVDCAFAPDTFHAIGFNHTLERLPDAEAALRFAHQIMKPGGLLFGLTPNIRSFAAKQMGADWPWLDSEHNYLHFAPDTLTKLLEKCGFNTIEYFSRVGDFDLNALRALIAKSTPAEDVEGTLNDLNVRGYGEELLFFARK